MFMIYVMCMPVYVHALTFGWRQIEIWSVIPEKRCRTKKVHVCIIFLYDLVIDSLVCAIAI